MHAWLRSLDPAILTRWIVYARINPAAFDLAGGSEAANGSSRDTVAWVTADQVGEMWAERYGGR